MSIFNLPDLGEGLPDAEISEWLVKEGDTVTVDQPIVSMETAKAIVEVPSPQAGTIKKLHGKTGDIIKTGAPLVEFEGETKTEDKGTVVGNIESSGETVEESFTVGAIKSEKTGQTKATPAVRMLAKQLGVDLSQVTGSGKNGMVTADDIKAAASGSSSKPASADSHFDLEADNVETLHGVRRAMAITMSQSHAEVVPVTIYDDADIHGWSQDCDFSTNIIQSIVVAATAEPAINAWYDGQSMSRQMHNHINVGLAVDTGKDLFVPVIQNAQDKSAADLRAEINKLKQAVQDRSLHPEDMQHATITLSNFGNFAGRYASPIIVPPMVAIIAIGRMREAVVPEKGKPAVHRVLPLSLTFDHRAVTGGEATRFLGEMIKALEASE